MTHVDASRKKIEQNSSFSLNRWSRFIVIALLVAILCGISGTVFKESVSLLTTFFFGVLLPLITIHIGSFNFAYVILPVIGAAITSPFILKYAKTVRGGGIGAVLESVTFERAKIQARVWPAKLIASAITMGSGGSAGPEGPIIQASGAASSYVAGLFHLTPNEKRALVACGVGAGLAAIFNSPLGVGIFAMELLFPTLDFYFVVPVFLSSIVGSLIGQTLPQQVLGFSLISFPTSYTLGEYGLFAVFGVAIGLLAFVWIRLYGAAYKGFIKTKLPLVLLPVVGAALTGLLIAFLPGYGIEGGGEYGLDNAILTGLPAWLFFTLGFCKMLSTASTVASGNSGGLFFPSVYIGGMFGGGFAAIFQVLFPSVPINAGVFILIGAGAFFAASAQEPIGITVILLELSRNFLVVIPLLLTTIIAFFIAFILAKGVLVYTSGHAMARVRNYTLSALMSFRVESDSIDIVPVASPNDSIDIAYDMFSRESIPAMPVVHDDYVVGVLSTQSFKKLDEARWHDTSVQAIMDTDFPRVKSSDSLLTTVDAAGDTGYAVVEQECYPNQYLGIFLKDKFIQLKHLPVPYM